MESSKGIFRGSNGGFQMLMIFIPCSRDQNGFLSLNPGIYYSSYRLCAKEIVSRKKDHHNGPNPWKKSPKQNWLVVEPTHLTNMSQIGFIFPLEFETTYLKPPPRKHIQLVILDCDSWQPKNYTKVRTNPVNEANLSRERSLGKKWGTTCGGTNIWRFWYRCSTSGSPPNLMIPAKAPRLEDVSWLKPTNSTVGKHADVQLNFQETLYNSRIQ